METEDEVHDEGIISHGGAGGQRAIRGRAMKTCGVGGMPGGEERDQTVKLFRGIMEFWSF